MEDYKRLYLEYKEKCPNHIVLVRQGEDNIYKTFDKDADTCSSVLGVAEFGVDKLGEYLPKLVRAGHRVAIYEPSEYVPCSTIKREE